MEKSTIYSTLTSWQQFFKKTSTCEKNSHKKNMMQKKIHNHLFASSQLEAHLVTCPWTARRICNCTALRCFQVRSSYLFLSQELPRLPEQFSGVEYIMSRAGLRARSPVQGFDYPGYQARFPLPQPYSLLQTLVTEVGFDVVKNQKPGEAGGGDRSRKPG